MNVGLLKVSLQEKEKLENLMQLYLHDISLYFEIPFDSNSCIYNYDLTKYFEDDLAYFIMLDNDIAGFVLIDNNDDYEISEMFILNNYKRKGIGQTAINKIFDMHKGNWTIKVVPNSLLAENFCLKVVKKYTSNNFEFKRVGKYNRVELYFKNS